MKRILLCIHGIRTGDGTIAWRRELDATLRLAGLGDLKRQGWELVAPDYWDLMTANPAPMDDPPDPTFAKPSEEQHTRDAGAYWLACSRLEAALRDHARGGPSHLADMPADYLAKAVVPLVFPTAREYCRSFRRRNAIQRRVLQAIPEECKLGIIGFSLGSVVAADLLYHVPRSCSVSLLVTMGSPIHLKEVSSHLRRMQSSFPFGRTGPWLNCVGRFDPVTASRGINAIFPEALDVYVDTGLDSAHQPEKYLSQPALARAFHWLEELRPTAPFGRHLEPRVPDELIPLLGLAQYALRLTQAQKRGNQRTRYEAARALTMESLRQELVKHGIEHPVVDHLTQDNADLLEGRFQDQPVTLVDALLAAHMSNPVDPYEIHAPQAAKIRALQALAGDLGVPTAWADIVIAAINEARKAHASFPAGKVALGAAAAALLIAAPYMVLVAAPAGAAGGAAIVGGLAALGPGGMFGGLVIVSAVGGAGGAAAVGALTSGSPAAVAQRVVFLQARALACSQLGNRDPASPEWFWLTAMVAELARDHARHKQLSDRKSRVRDDLAEKLKAVRTAIAWLVEKGLDPASLPPGDGAAALAVGRPAPVAEGR